MSKGLVVPGRRRRKIDPFMRRREGKCRVARWESGDIIVRRDVIGGVVGMGTDLLRRRWELRWRSDACGRRARNGGARRPRLPAGGAKLEALPIALSPALVPGVLDGPLLEEAAQGLAVAVGALLGVCAGAVDLVDDLLRAVDLWQTGW
jgi:hypothetical protein